MNKYLEQYLVAVQHSEVSGFEQREMLLIRDRLAKQEATLTLEERSELAKADRRLLAQRERVHAELSRITSLEIERERRQPTPDQWWWYLDVLTQLPELPPSIPGKPEPV